MFLFLLGVLVIFVGFLDIVIAGCCVCDDVVGGGGGWDVTRGGGVHGA